MCKYCGTITRVDPRTGKRFWYCSLDHALEDGATIEDERDE